MPSDWNESFVQALYYKVTLCNELVHSILQAFYIQSLLITQTYRFVFDGRICVRIFVFIERPDPESYK